MTSTNGIEPAGLPLAPTPNRERFRLRVEVFLPQDAHSYNAKPYHSFILAKSRSLNLPELSLRELRDVVVYRYKTIYPNETLFQISKTTTALGDDLFLDDSVGDIFADNEVFRVIKGASIRESLPRNYRESRERSLQPSNQPSHNGRKRSPNTSNMGDLSRAGKRQRFHEPERPIPSIERFAVIEEEDEGPGFGAEDEEVPDAEEPVQEEVQAPQETGINGANAAEIVASAPVAQAEGALKRGRGRPPKPKSTEPMTKQPTPTVEAQGGSSSNNGKVPAETPAKRERQRGRKSRKSMSAAPAESPPEARHERVSTSPILPPNVGTGKQAAPASSAASTHAALKTLGGATSSEVLPPPTISQNQPPISAAETAQKSAPADLPGAAGASTTKKARRVSSAEPEPSPPVSDNTAHNTPRILPPASPPAQASKATNDDAPYAVIINGRTESFGSVPPSGIVVSDEGVDAQQSEDQDQFASSSQNKDSAPPTEDGKRGKRIASTISVYEKEKLARQAAQEKKRLAAELAAEKKAAKDAAKEAKAKEKAQAKAEAKAAKEAEKEAKRKEKEERKLASSQKAAKAEVKAPKPSAPVASATVKASVPITDDEADTIMDGMADGADDTRPMSPTPDTAPAPESLPLPPPSPIIAAKTPKQATPPPNPDRSPSEASTPGSASTSRSQRDSRSPVHFVTANSQAAAKSSFPGSGQKQGRNDESESDESSSSSSDDDDLDTASTIKPKTPAPITKEKDVASTQSMRSTSYIPPPTQPRLGGLSAGDKDNRRLSTTPIQPPQPKFGNNNNFGTAGPASRASDSPAPSLSQRPQAMAHMPSLKNQTAQALSMRHAEMERIRLEGQARAKKLHDEQVAKRKEEKVEVSEAETDSSSDDSDSDSDSDGSSSDGDAKKATPQNKRLLGLKGGAAAPASASKVEGKKKKIDFGDIRKRFSFGGSLK